MRISDWSSDVCSSDLSAPDTLQRCLNMGQRAAQRIGAGDLMRLQPRAIEVLQLQMQGKRIDVLRPRQHDDTEIVPMYRSSLGARHIGAEAAQLLESTPNEPKSRRPHPREGADPRTLSARDMAPRQADTQKTGN